MGREIRDLSLVAVLAVLLSPASGMAKPKGPLRLAASSQWLVNYAEDSCRMARTFGEGEQRVVLIADRYEPGDLMRLSFYGKPARAGADGDVRIRFGPTEAAQEIAFYPATLGEKTPGIILKEGVRIAPFTKAEQEAKDSAEDAEDFSFMLPDIGAEREQAVTLIEASRSIREPFVLETGSLGAPLAALRKCTDELLDHWGIDVAKHAGLTRRVMPKNRPSRWMSSNDYPAGMLIQGKRAIVHFRLNVDAEGKPSACHIQQSTRPEAFDTAVCKAIMRNARFEPALDAAGAPIASYWINTVIFHM